MSEIIAKFIECGIGVEKTRGTALTTVEKWLKRVSCNIIERADHARDESNMAKLEETGGRRVVKKWAEGDIEGNLHADAIGYILYNLYGAVVSTTVTGSVKSHVFSLAQNIIHPSLSIFVKDGSVQEKVFANGMVNSLEISASLDNFVKFVASFQAGAATTSAASPSYGTEYDFIAKDITIKVATTEAGLVGATALLVKDFKINFNQALLRDHVFGSYTPDDIYNAGMKITGSLMLNYTDNNFKDMFLDDTAKYMQIVIEGAADIGSANHPKITILLHKAQVMKWDASGKKGDELVTQAVDFEAFYNTSDSKQSQITLQNLTSEYDTPPSV